MANPISTSAYISDHSTAVIRAHSWRTAQNSCAYLIRHLAPTAHILDVGCGPGSITIDLAKLVPEGHVTGIEYTSAPLPGALALAAERGVSNVSFKEGDIHRLPFADAVFDVVHAHQVLQHIRDPIRGLREMKRVCKEGGIVAVRESAHIATYPLTPGLGKYGVLYDQVAKAKGGNPHPGGRIHGWAVEAGFERESVECSTGSWCFRTREEREFWGGGFAERCMEGGAFFENVVEGGSATTEEIGEIEGAWREWVKNKDGWCGVLHGEIICKK
ncbi:putative methyltransferase [Lachnellula occidentalis]|uniref:Putative methyltransferase n=1 Tax=Lachnellula occidentalis TaxID=215460 RepID=A0A8H8S683_9HELO|nr:putative methyltransferase [Lachnellula occidentalis]